ncbi:sugar efflux transporter [Pseudoalteromonas sp. R86517]|uniref:sugar efflux transporter n=1 Tax=Pseudoalteromonas sp. R86517 TaxID=3093857 RepID=UPI00366D1CD5
MIFKRALSLPVLFIFITSSLQAFLFSLTLPTLSYYISEKFSADAFSIGMFFILIALSGIVISQLMGNLSDRLTDRRPLITFGLFSGAISCYIFSEAHTYIVALLAGVTFFSISFSSISQIFAHAREYAEQSFNRKEIVMFNTSLRALSAFSWVGGPALGFILLNYFNFYSYYKLIALLYIACTALALFVLPAATISSSKVMTNAKPNALIAIAFIAFSLMFACNQAYIIALPLYVTQELGLDVSWAGWLMGTAAAIEIPIMLFAGWLGTRFAISSLVCIGAIAPIVLYLGFWQATELWILFPLQISNALMIGFIAGLGMTWFQDLMPNKTGAASALFWNTTNVGNILGAVIIASFAQLLGYRDVYLINTIMAITATILLLYAARRTMTIRVN